MLIVRPSGRVPLRNEYVYGLTPPTVRRAMPLPVGPYAWFTTPLGNAGTDDEINGMERVISVIGPGIVKVGKLIRREKPSLQFNLRELYDPIGNVVCQVSFTKSPGAWVNSGLTRGPLMVEAVRL